MKRKNRNDKGYIIAFIAILILPILGFTSFSVDLGSWYAKAAELQQAADAAALGGAAFLPDPTRAETKAKEIAAMNGFAHNPPDVTVNVEIPPDDPKVIIVTITLDEFPRYFSQVFENDNLSFSRTSRAEYLPAPKIGSPRNFLGTGHCYLGNSDTGTSETVANGPFSVNACPVSARENWWLSVNYACTERESADRFVSYVDATNQTVIGGGTVSPSGQKCQTQTKQTFSVKNTNGTDLFTNKSAYFAENPEYQPEGYYYGITIKAQPAASAAYVLEGFSMGQGVRDGATQNCKNGPSILVDSDGNPDAIETAGDKNQNAQFSVDWKVYDNNAFDPRVTPITSKTVTVDANNCWQYSGWYSFNDYLLTAGPGETKTYWLQVQPKPYQDLKASNPSMNAGRGVNVFSLRVRNANNFVFSPCSSLSGDIISYSEYCPEIYGVENLPTLTTFDFSVSDLERSFFLAQLPDEYINRTVSVEVFDPDPFVSKISIVNEGAPSGQTLQEFTPRILCRDGKQAVNEVCEPFSQKVFGGGTVPIIENPPTGTSGGRPVSYNNMSKTTAFSTFRGPASLPSSTSCITNPTCQTWFVGASNTDYNNGENAFWGLNNRTLRMSYMVPQPDVTDTNNWWKIRFGVYNTINSLPTDRMTWTLKVSGEPVRLLPNQIPYDLVPATP